MSRARTLSLYTNTFLLITLVPQPLLLSIYLFLLIDSLFYLYIFTPILFIEIFTLYTLLLSIHIWISDIIMTFFKTLTTLYPFLFITMLLFINSETLLFIAYLWIIFNYLWIYIYVIILISTFILMSTSIPQDTGDAQASN